MIDAKVKSIGRLAAIDFTISTEMADDLPSLQRVSGKSPAFAEQNFLARPESLFSYSHPKCKPLAKRLGEMRRPANQALNLCASLREGSPGYARRAGSISPDQTWSLSNWHS